ncbi:MAG: RNA polymerase sigma factor [Gemmatimonadota bacterium]
MTPHAASTALGHLLRDLAPQVLGALARRHGDFADAEDAVQEALIAAAERWPRDGVPDNPGGWLYHVAVRRLTDRVRSEQARRRREAETRRDTPIEAEAPALDLAEDTLGMGGDDTLLLLFMCCHPALTPASAVALTLRAVGGLTTAEIARAFLVPESTMAQRISRAKQGIKSSGVPFREPGEGERAGRLQLVLQVLYLIFNEGYTSSSGPSLQRLDLSSEAIRLARALHRLLPNDGEVAGLLALMLLTDARRAARAGAYGELIPLDEQDRTRWDAALIAEGWRWCRGRCGVGAWAPISFKRRLPPCTTRRRAPRRPTGRRSWRCTPCCCVSPTTRWWRSTARWRWRWWRGRRQD